MNNLEMDYRGCRKADSDTQKQNIGFPPEMGVMLNITLRRRKRMSKKLLSIALAMFMLLTLAACSGGGAPSPAPSEEQNTPAIETPSPSQTAAESAANTPVDLTFITPQIYVTDASDQGQIKNFERASAVLAEQFPNVKFSYEEYPHSTYEDKVKSLAAADNLPDIFILKATMVKPLVKAGQIISFDDALNADAEWKDNFKEGMFVEATYQDKIWAIPEYSSMNGILYYNIDLLHQLGFQEFPKTLTELWKLIDAAKAANMIPFAAGSTGGWEAFSLFQNGLLYRFTGSQWFVDIFNRKEGVSFLDKEFIDAAAEGQKFAMNGAFNDDWYEIGHDEAIALFTSGKALMTFSGSWVISTIAQSGMDISKVGLAAMPKAEGYPKGDMTIHGSTGWMLFSNKSCQGDKYDPMLCFIKDMSNATYATTRLQASSFPAMNPDDTIDYDTISPLVIQHDKLVSECGQSLVIDCVMDPQVVEILYQDTVSLFMGTITPEQFAQNVQKEYDEVKAAE